MGERGGTRGRRTAPGIWPYLLTGSLVMFLVSGPFGPLSPGRWPRGGAFGAFTWAAWVVSGALAVAAGFAGVSARGNPRLRAWRGAIGFASLAAVSVGAAAGASEIERRPLVALVVAAGALWAYRRLGPG